MIRLIALCLCLATLAHAANPFAEHVRTTPKRSPEEARKLFELPAGFEAQLVAAEPDILKPMNLAFDARGRIWVTLTQEYPYAAPPNRKGRDVIKILEDTDNDGRADIIKTFADGLNIPIGILPYRDGVIAWSIPNLWYFKDNDGDDRADERIKLFGPLGFERDTHGMNASFTRGYDGWVYATHGFNNRSTFVASDGSTITLQSGNTYRFLPDGSHVAQHTSGQVNPFGLCFDSQGNLFSADCHSKPLYQLLAGGDYPHFGKKPGGLGFAPAMVRHTHGSTALCGVFYYDDNLWPEEFRGNLFVGNVMTSRVNRDRLVAEGSTLNGVEMPDFIATKDPWFRPVDIKLGPDGALYVADFYNRIIGHYEVPLDHPGRDRTSGRIWRIVYRGKNGEHNARPRRDLSRADVPALVRALGDANLTHRMLAMNEVVDRIGAGAVPALRRAFDDGDTPAAARPHLIWAMERLNGLPSRQLEAALEATDWGLRTHALRILAHRKTRTPGERQWAFRALKDENAFVRRTAVEALARDARFANLKPFLALRGGTPPEDTHTTYAIRKALRDGLAAEDYLEQLAKGGLSDAEADAVADVCRAIDTPSSAAFLLKYSETHDTPRPELVERLNHVVRHVSEADLDRLATFVPKKFADDLDFQLELLGSVLMGLKQRGVTVKGQMKAWAERLTRHVLVERDAGPSTWVYKPLRGNDGNPWVRQLRNSADGQKRKPFLCTLPSGEQRTGILRSQPFSIPETLTFWIAGHDGFPDVPLQGKNKVLIRQPGTERILATVPAPRNDLAQLVTLDLKAHAGKKGIVELVDADTAGAYAWLAVGRFNLPELALPGHSPEEHSRYRTLAATLAGELGMTGLGETLTGLAANTAEDPGVRAAAVDSVAILKLPGTVPLLSAIMENAREPEEFRGHAAVTLVRAGGSSTFPSILDALKSAPRPMQIRLATALAGNRAGAAFLMDRVGEGKLPPVLLLERSVRDKILAASVEGGEARLAALTKGANPPEAELQKAIEAGIAAFQQSEASIQRGQALFNQHCGACHQLQGKGGNIGPQLDGIGNRGLARLVEDVMDPNRNVDVAFRTTNISLKDGEIVSGLFRREEGTQVILANAVGKEFSVPRDAIASRTPSNTSLMPSNFAELLGRQGFNDLLAFLLNQN